MDSPCLVGRTSDGVSEDFCALGTKRRLLALSLLAVDSQTALVAPGAHGSDPSPTGTIGSDPCTSEERNWAAPEPPRITLC
eukprot:scaffold188_cov429-Prasinococcus_capsulatus_cf.AAC.9